MNLISFVLVSVLMMLLIVVFVMFVRCVRLVFDVLLVWCSVFSSRCLL